MECLPTGSEGETLVPLTKNSAELFNTESIKQFFTNNSWIIKVLVVLVIVVVLIKLGGYLFSKYEKKTAAATTQSGGATALPKHILPKHILPKHILPKHILKVMKRYSANKT